MAVRPLVHVGDPVLRTPTTPIAVEDLGSAVLMLASRLANFVTGQTLMCDGGASVTTARASMRHGVERDGSG